MELTEETVIAEMKRVAVVLNDTTLTWIAYEANCQRGFSSYLIKKQLGFSFADIKKKCGFKTKKNASAEKTASLRDKMFTIYCPALNNGKGGMLKKLHCVPGYRPECETCESIQDGNPISKED